VVARRDLVVIGASAGSLQPLTTVVAGLSEHFAACVVIVVHTAADRDGLLPKILARYTELPVAFAAEGSPVAAGRIYVAKPDFQLLVGPRGLSVVHGPKENGFRPAIDPLFRSAARTFGAGVVGVILSGALDDGVAGLETIKEAGGVAIAQHPDDAMFPSMPRAAIQRLHVDYVQPAGAIGRLLERLCAESPEEEAAPDATAEPDPQLPGGEMSVADMQGMFGLPTPLTCPACGGALWRVEAGQIERFRCHVGHQFGGDSLLREQTEAAEAALWTAVRTLEEQAELKKRMATRAENAGMPLAAREYANGSREAHQQAHSIRRLLFARGRTELQSEETATTETGNSGSRR